MPQKEHFRHRHPLVVDESCGSVKCFACQKRFRGPAYYCYESRERHSYDIEDDTAVNCDCVRKLVWASPTVATTVISKRMFIVRSCRKKFNYPFTHTTLSRYCNLVILKLNRHTFVAISVTIDVTANRDLAFIVSSAISRSILTVLECFLTSITFNMSATSINWHKSKWNYIGDITSLWNTLKMWYVDSTTVRRAEKCVMVIPIVASDVISRVRAIVLHKQIPIIRSSSFFGFFWPTQKNSFLDFSQCSNVV